METILIEIKSSKAYKLLADLENLNILKIITRKPDKEQNLSDKYAGKLNKTTAKKLHDYVKQNREEWNNKDI